MISSTLCSLRLFIDILLAGATHTYTYISLWTVSSVADDCTRVCARYAPIRPSFSSFMCAYLSRFDIHYVSGAVCMPSKILINVHAGFSMKTITHTHTHFSHRHHILCTMHRLWVNASSCITLNIIVQRRFSGPIQPLFSMHVHRRLPTADQPRKKISPTWILC